MNFFRRTHVILLFASILFMISCVQDSVNREQDTDLPELTGAYLGQTPPGDEPELFAPGIVCNGFNNRDMAITPEGNELFYTNHFNFFLCSVIMHTRIVDGVWTEPEVAAFSRNPRYVYAEPHITPDGKHLYYLSNKPSSEDGESSENIWAVDKIDGGWGEPYILGEPISTDDNDEFFASVTNDGTLYFTRSKPGAAAIILRSKRVEGIYQNPEVLPEQVNCGADRYNAFISPDESYLIVCVAGMPDSKGGTDYYVVFRNEDDTWSEPINMGDKVNTASSREYAPYVSPDGKYFFFMAMKVKDIPERPPVLTSKTMKELLNGPQMGTTDIYWIKADFIEQLRPID